MIIRQQHDRWDIVLSDCPWHYNDKLPTGHEGAEHHYDVLKPDEIINLPVHRIASENSVSLMWTTLPQLPIALEAMTEEKWGFEFKTVPFIWVKRYPRSQKLKKLLKKLQVLWEEERLGRYAEWGEFVTDLFIGRLFKGQGRYTFANIELCLLGTRGGGISRVANNLFQIVIAPHPWESRVRGHDRFKKKKHSAKPTIFRNKIVTLFGDRPRIELFARSKGVGWDATGYDYDGVDIRDFLSAYATPETVTAQPGSIVTGKSPTTTSNE